MKNLHIIGLTTLLVGCGMATSRPTIAPDGRPAAIVECRKGIGDCWEQAGLVCPSGYSVLDGEDESHKVAYASASRSYGMAFATTKRHTTIMIVCNDGQTPHIVKDQL